MNKPILIASTVLISLSVRAQTNTPSAVAQMPTASQPISAKEMLLVGPSPMKLHALSVITQNIEKNNIDESYLPGLKVCAEDPDDLVRSVTAKLLGKYFIEGKETPDPTAAALITKLAGDTSSLVRYNAIYYGLAAMEDKSAEIIALLIEAVSIDRDSLLNEQITQSLKNYHDETVKILDEKLKTDNPITFFEIYEPLTGVKPVATERLLNMPSSRPVLFVFMGGGDHPDKFKAELKNELKALGLQNPEIFDAGSGDNYAVLLKTFVTRDRVTVEEAFTNQAKFPMPQIWWLTPEVEVLFDNKRNK